MVITIINKSNNIRLATVLAKYSDVEIANYFNHNANLNNQLSALYKNDPIKKKRVIQNIINEHIEFKNALIDPTIARNAKKIEEHQSYFWKPFIVENGQIRGPQIHYSQNMFSDFGRSFNGIETTGLNGIYLSSCMDTKKISTVNYPVSLKATSPDSFREAIELSASKTYSSIFNHEVFYTNDNALNIPKHSILLSNMPPNQKICDFAVSHDKVQGVVSQNDIKNQALDVAMYGRTAYQPRSVFVGTVSNGDEQWAYKTHLQHALNNNLAGVEHVDSSQNTFAEKYKIIKLAQSTGLLSDTKDLIGIATVISTDHNV